MTLPWTAALLIVGLGMTLIARWQEARPRPLGEVPIFPAAMVMGIGLIVCVVAAAHLLALLTGVPLHGRRGF